MAKPEMYRTKAGERRFQVAAPVPEEVYQGLRKLAFDEQTTLAAQVRKAVTDYVTTRQPPSRRIK